MRKTINFDDVFVFVVFLNRMVKSDFSKEGKDLFIGEEGFFGVFEDFLKKFAAQPFLIGGELPDEIEGVLMGGKGSADGDAHCENWWD